MTWQELLATGDRIMHVHTLLSAGATHSQLSRAVRAGTALRCRRGWYAHPLAPRALRRAVMAGGRLTSLSLFAYMGAWTMPGGPLHVAVNAGTSRLHATGGPSVRVHWRSSRDDSYRYEVREPMRLALRDALAEPEENAIVAIDSLLNKRLITYADVKHGLGGHARGRRWLKLIDGRSDSGLETLVRLRLQLLHLRVRTQVNRLIAIEGVGGV